jgi:hypothetical protein
MEAALGVIITLLVALLGVLLSHLSKCSVQHERTATLESEVKALKEEIGDHDSGIRGSIHVLNNRVTPIALWAERQMEKE